MVTSDLVQSDLVLADASVGFGLPVHLLSAVSIGKGLHHLQVLEISSES